MKTVKYLIITLLLGSFFTACKKDKDVAPAYRMEGTWSGKLGENKETPDAAFVIVIKPNNVVERINASGQTSGTGPWSISGNKFTASYTASNGIRVDIRADLNTSENKLTGTWSNTADRKGTFYAVKKVNN